MKNYNDWNKVIVAFTMFMMNMCIPEGMFVFIVLGIMMLIINGINLMYDFDTKGIM